MAEIIEVKVTKGYQITLAPEELGSIVVAMGQMTNAEYKRCGERMGITTNVEDDEAYQLYTELRRVVTKGENNND